MNFWFPVGPGRSPFRNPCNSKKRPLPVRIFYMKDKGIRINTRRISEKGNRLIGAEIDETDDLIVSRAKWVIIQENGVVIFRLEPVTLRL